MLGLSDFDALMRAFGLISPPAATAPTREASATEALGGFDQSTPLPAIQHHQASPDDPSVDPQPSSPGSTCSSSFSTATTTPASHTYARARRVRDHQPPLALLSRRMTASSSSSDHSSPSSLSNLDDPLAPSSAFSAFVPFEDAAKLAPTGNVTVVGDDSFHHPLAHPSARPANGRQLLASTLSKASVAASSPTVGMVTRDNMTGRRFVDVGPAGARNLPLIVGGVPRTGAKSRVETQIKIRLALALPNPPGGLLNSLPTPSSSAASDASADDESHLAFVSTYTHVKLQKGTATKRKSRRAAGDSSGLPKPEQTLYLETEVYCATEGVSAEELAAFEDGSAERKEGLRVFACQGCRTREVKRAQRKLAARIRPTLSDSDLDYPFPVAKPGASPITGGQDERHKIVLFNCGALIDFSQGECTLPARVTCYCRHHREKSGFLLKFLLKDHLGNVIGSGLTPPIMITDDHKTSNKAAANQSGPESASAGPTLPRSLVIPSQPSPPPPATSPLAAAATKASRIRRAVKQREPTSSDDDRKLTAAKPYDRKPSPSTAASSAAPTPRTLSIASKSAASSPGHGLFRHLSLSPAGVQNQPLGIFGPGGLGSAHLSPTLAGYEGGALSLGLQNVNSEPPPETCTPGDLISRHTSQEPEMTPKDILSGEMTQENAMAGAMSDAASAATLSENVYDPSSAGSQYDEPGFMDFDHAGGLDPATAALLEHQAKDGNGMQGGQDSEMDEAAMAFDALVDYDGVSSTNESSRPRQQQRSNLGFPDFSNLYALDVTLQHSMAANQQQQQQAEFDTLFALPASPPSSIPSPTLCDLSQRQYHHNSRDASVASTTSTTSSASFTPHELMANASSWPNLSRPQFSTALLTPRPSASRETPVAPPQRPCITRLIPGEGPVHGGIEVTILGQNFVPGLTCVFGDSIATSTQIWSENTIVCLLPPSSCPGPVVVTFKADSGIWAAGGAGGPEGGLQLFTYLDTSDRALMELALQVVGLKMTGRIEDAKNVALRIVGQGSSGENSSTGSGHFNNDGGYSQHSRAAYHSSSASLSHSRRGSTDDSGNNTATSMATLPWGTGSRGGNFQDTILNFLTLVDLDTSDLPGSAFPSPQVASAVSTKNRQGQTLLHLAVMLGFHRLVTHLIALGADLDSRDRNGYTALALSALCGRVACTRLLLDAGASDEIVTADGKSPAELAREKDHIDVELLLARTRPSELTSIDLAASVSASASEDSIDADNPSSDEEDEERLDDVPSITTHSNGSLSSMPAPYMVRGRRGAKALRRRGSIDSQQTEATLYAARPLDDGYHSDGSSVRHSLHQHHLEMPSSKDNLEEPLDIRTVSEKDKNGSTTNHHVESWLRRTLSNTQQKFPFPQLPSVPTLSDMPTLAFPTTMAMAAGNLPSLPAQLHQYMPWSREDKGAAFQADKEDVDPNEQQPTWAHYTAVYPWLPFALAQWIKEMGPSMPPVFSPSGDKGVPGRKTKGKKTSRAVEVVPGTPPPSYENFSAQQQRPVASTSTVSPPTPTQPTVSRASVRRQLGYEPNQELTDREIAKFGHHAAKRRKIKQDRMLWMFWLPIFLLVCSYTIISNLPLVFGGVRRIAGRLLPFRGLIQ